MKVLKSHRDPYFLRWNQEDWAIWGRPSSLATFDYVSIEIMQRGDVTQESEQWLKKNADQNFDLLGSLRVSIPRDGMISPLILVSTKHSYWAPFVGKNFWSTIPFVIQTGNNRYRVAVDNGYTHISSICLGANIDPPVWNYLQRELKRPPNEKIAVSKEYVSRYTGDKLL